MRWVEEDIVMLTREKEDASVSERKAEILINGPRGQVFTEVQTRDDGKIDPAFAEQALAHALNIYNELEP